MSNYFGVGLALFELLRSMLDDNGNALFKRVDFLQNLADVGEQRQITPACYVIYRGESVGDVAGRGQKVQVKQRYTVVIAVANATSQINALGVVKTAGELIPVVLKALQGKQITDNASPLLRVGSDNASFSNAFSYYPFTFESSIVI